MIRDRLGRPVRHNDPVRIRGAAVGRQRDVLGHIAHPFGVNDAIGWAPWVTSPELGLLPRLVSSEDIELLDVGLPGARPAASPPPRAPSPPPPPPRKEAALEDDYRLLGLEVGAPPSEVQASYRQLAKHLHPDSAHPGITPKQAKELFQRVTEAYQRLRGANPGRYNNE